MDAVLSIHNLSKKYTLSQAAPYVALRDVITNSFKTLFSKKKPSTFWALKDINLEIKQGDRVGIVGHNGAGKSTLLKIISRITPPTTGKIILEGRVASLLEVGTGFHPELTGRENIYLNGSILGLKKWEIDKKLDEIIEFSGVEKFIDTPLKHYSSGMQLRLAFSVAAHLEPEILLIDEVLAVGDMEFQKKCIGKMEEVSQQHGRTLLFVSHNLQQLKAICNKGIWLEKGRLALQSTIENTIQQYTHSIISEKQASWQTPEDKEEGFIELQLKNKTGKPIMSVITANDEWQLEVTLIAKKVVANSLIALRITNSENLPVFTTTNGDALKKFPLLEQGTHHYTIPLPVQLLTPGKYSIIVAWIVPGFKELDSVKGKVYFEVEDEQYPGHVLKDGRLGVINHTIAWKKM